MTHTFLTLVALTYIGAHARVLPDMLVDSTPHETHSYLWRPIRSLISESTSPTLPCMMESSQYESTLPTGHFLRLEVVNQEASQGKERDQPQLPLFTMWIDGDEIPTESFSHLQINLEKQEEQGKAERVLVAYTNAHSEESGEQITITGRNFSDVVIARAGYKKLCIVSSREAAV